MGSFNVNVPFPGVPIFTDTFLDGFGGGFDIHPDRRSFHGSVSIGAMPLDPPNYTIGVTGTVTITFINGGPVVLEVTAPARCTGFRSPPPSCCSRPTATSRSTATSTSTSASPSSRRASARSSTCRPRSSRPASTASSSIVGLLRDLGAGRRSRPRASPPAAPTWPARRPLLAVGWHPERGGHGQLDLSAYVVKPVSVARWPAGRARSRRRGGDGRRGPVRGPGRHRRRRAPVGGPAPPARPDGRPGGAGPGAASAPAVASDGAKTTPPT